MTINQLEALEQAATAGPWEVVVTGNTPWPDRFDIVGANGTPTAPICAMTCQTDTECTSNSAAIAAARNSLPALLAVAKAAQKSLDQLSYILEVAHNEQQDEVLYPNMLAEIGTRREELRAALSRLEAQ